MRAALSMLLALLPCAPAVLAQGSPGGAGSLIVNEPALNFGTLLVGTTGGAQTITLVNDGLVPVLVSSATAATTGETGSSDFQVFSGSCALPQQLLPQSSCTLSVSFTPAVAAAESGTVTILDSTAASPETVALSGIGVATAQVLEAAPPNLVFSNQMVGTTSAANLITFNNTGTQQITIDSVSTSGPEFQVSSTSCTGITIYPAVPPASCQVGVTFTPSATGPRTGALTLMDTVSGTPQVFNLVGYGVPATPLAPPLAPFGTALTEPASIDFGPQPQGIPSTGMMVTVANPPGTLSAQINSVTLTGKFASDFAVDQAHSTCNQGLPLVLAPGAQCQLFVTFTPTSASGAETATLVIGTAARDLNISLAGSAEPAEQIVSFTPLTMTFDPRQMGSTDGTQYVVYVTNLGTKPVNLGGAPTFSGTNPADFQVSAADTCAFFFNAAAALLPYQGCEFQVQFTPTSATLESAVLSLSSTFGALQMQLTGQGTATPPAVSLIPATVAFAAEPFTTLSFPQAVLFTNNSSSPIKLNQAALTGAAFSIANGGDTCSGFTVPANGGSCQVAVTFTPPQGAYPQPELQGSLTLTDQSKNSYVAALAGDSIPNINSATLNPEALQFSPVAAGAAAYTNLQEPPPFQTLTLTNTGTSSLAVGNLSFSDGPDFNDDGAVGFNGCSATAVPPGKTCTVGVVFTPVTVGPKSTTIALSVSYGNGDGSNLLATATGTGTKDIDSVLLSPENFTFSDEPAGLPLSDAYANTLDIIQLVNYSTLPVTVGTITGKNTIVGASTKGDFVVGPQYMYCQGATLSGAPPFSQPFTQYGNCYVYVYFAPHASGPKAGSITIPVTFADGTTRNYTQVFSGNAIAPVTTVFVTPSTAQFLPEVAGTRDPSNSAQITVTNTGNLPITFTASTLSGADFSIAGDACAGTSLEPQSSCIVSVLFTPLSTDAPGTYSGTLTIHDSAAGNPQAVALGGTAIAASQQLAVSQTSIAFGKQAEGTSSEPVVVYVINQGSAAAIPLKSVKLKSTNDLADFSESDTCGGASGSTLGARSSCAITVIFNPVANSSGTRYATVTVTPVKGAPIVISITGIETQPST